LNALRSFCIDLLEKRPDFSVELDCYEEGYMAVALTTEGFGKLAELHVVSSDDYVFGLFVEGTGQEFHFNKIEEGLEFLDSVEAVKGRE
ncbi:MAG: hypothetical protein MI725_13205, partial [Pirellulales bacterium]|nr:hypothetical protein [Pirellulales bacterium]